MPVLFVLLPTDAPIDALPASAGVAVRRYPRADDARHLASLVRAGRDPAATRWRRGALRAVLFGAGVGGCVNGLLAGCAGLFAGMLDLAIPLGLGVGAFLGGFTAAMTGMSSAAWKDRMDQMPQNEREIVLRAEGYVGTEGGLPILEAGQLIGGVGVSGAATGRDDARCAEAGLSAIAPRS